MSKLLFAFIASTLLLQPALVSAEIKFATGGGDGCSATQITEIKRVFGEATQLADAAIKALNNPQVVGSKSFIDFLGASNGNIRGNIAQKNYQTVKTILNGPSGNVADINDAGQDDIVFVCPPHVDQIGKEAAKKIPTTCKGVFTGLARPKDDKTPRHRVRLCPIFFGPQEFTVGTTKRTIAPAKLAVAAANHKTGTKYGSSPAMTILHELQHLDAVVGAPFLDDLPTKIPPETGPLTEDTKSYTVKQCAGLGDADKLKNAQNVVWFAMDVFADPERGLPCAAGTGAATGSGSGTASGSNSPKAPAKVITRRAVPKVAAAPKAAAKKPAVAAPKKVTPAAAPPKAAKPVAAKPAPVAAKPVAAKPVAAKPAPVAAKKPAPVAAKPAPVAAKPAPVAAKPAPVAAKPAPVAAKPAPVAAKPKPNPLGGGTAPSGPRLARPARISASSSKPTPTKSVGSGAKVGTGAKTTSTGVKKPTSTTTGTKKPTATPTGKVSAPVCKILRRADVEPITADGNFVL